MRHAHALTPGRALAPALRVTVAAPAASIATRASYGRSSFAIDAGFYRDLDDLSGDGADGGTAASSFLSTALLVFVQQVANAAGFLAEIFRPASPRPRGPVSALSPRGAAFVSARPTGARPGRCPFIALSSPAPASRRSDEARCEAVGHPVAERETDAQLRSRGQDQAPREGDVR